MSKKYRSSQGKMVDMAAIILKNEKVRAVGNMNVNARGDQIDSEGNIIMTRDELMKKHYKVTEKEVPQKLEPDTDEETDASK